MKSSCFDVIKFQFDEQIKGALLYIAFCPVVRTIKNDLHTNIIHVAKTFYYLRKVEMKMQIHKLEFDNIKAA